MRYPCLPSQLNEILNEERSLTLPRFTADDAFDIGANIRNRLRSLSEQPAVVNITLANSHNLVFHATSRSGILPDNDLWIARKRKTVLRWGVSSWVRSHGHYRDQTDPKTSTCTTKWVVTKVPSLRSMCLEIGLGSTPVSIPNLYSKWSLSNKPKSMVAECRSVCTALRELLLSLWSVA
jgi:hypothetical protein